MKHISAIILGIIFLFANNALAKDGFIQQCKKDLEYVRLELQKNSAPYKNKSDKAFHEWYQKGYEDTLKLIDGIEDRDDCFYAMKYYINGFQLSHISIRGYVPLPEEAYPGILSVKRGKNHRILYKHPALTYLKDVSVGDRITHINDIEMGKYYQDYLLPFYANDKSKLTKESASIYALIVDGNRFKPTPKNITVEHEGASVKIQMKYTELSAGGLDSAKKVKQPDVAEIFKIEMVSSGVWIKIPSFFPNREESVYYTGMLSKLKNDLAKEDYILFDMRGNRGGASKWARPIIRNLWGDKYLKSLGNKHGYNQQWHKKLRISKDNFSEFKRGYSANAAKAYASSLKKGDSYFLKKWSIFDDKENLYTNKDDKAFNAKVYVLTDNFCRSTCWSFVNALRQIPGVVHIGGKTTIQSRYSFAKKERAPSEDFDFFYPTQIRVQPDHRIGEALVPSVVFKGDFRDEASVIDWILSITESEAE